MVHEKWATSDTHFFHANILMFFDKDGKRIRPFNSLDDMHNTIVKNWNSVVGVNDYVYHLGDVTFQYHKAFTELMHSLNGRKRMLIGNHDKLNKQCFNRLLGCFEKVYFWKGFKEFGFTMTHIPQRLESLRDGNHNVHGHTHQNSLEDKHYHNVCLEVRNFTPVHFDTLIEEIKAYE